MTSEHNARHIGPGSSLFTLPVSLQRATAMWSAPCRFDWHRSSVNTIHYILVTSKMSIMVTTQFLQIVSSQLSNLCRLLFRERGTLYLIHGSVRNRRSCAVLPTMNGVLENSVGCLRSAIKKPWNKPGRGDPNAAKGTRIRSIFCFGCFRWRLKGFPWRDEKSPCLKREILVSRDLKGWHTTVRTAFIYYCIRTATLYQLR